jgi:hypothetical protein
MVPAIAWPSQLLSFHSKKGLKCCHMIGTYKP